MPFQINFKRATYNVDVFWVLTLLYRLGEDLSAAAVFLLDDRPFGGGNKVFKRVF